MNETLIMLNVMMVVINVAAAVASVTFAIRSALVMRRAERQRRMLWERK